MRVCLDVDFIIFDAVSVAEEKFVTCKHRPTGKVLIFDNRTDLYGDWRSKKGGWIGEQNELAGEELWKAEDFDITDGQRERPFKVAREDEDGNAVTVYVNAFEGAKKIVRDKIKAICEKLGATSYFGFTGPSHTFRHDVATLLPYKGQRSDFLKPLLLEKMKKYVVDELNITLVEGIEADDAVSMATVEGYENWKKNGCKDEDKVVAVAVDKDAKQTTGWHYNPNKDTEPRLITGLGSLWLDKKDEVDGCGRMWLYYQIAVGDATDNYKSNCFSKVRYGSKSAYNDLKDCKTDKEAFTALVRVFKKLYPEKQTVEGCKGPVEIDWLYVFQEMATLAMMQRKPNDKIDIKSVLTKLEINYDD